MDFSPLDPTKVAVLIGFGGSLVLFCFWLTFRTKADGHSAKIVLLGMKFESSSAGFLVSLIRAAFLAMPLFASGCGGPAAPTADSAAVSGNAIGGAGVNVNVGQRAAVDEIVPTRAFLGPHRFPPEGYRGYGLLAFTSLATQHDIDRHLMICAAFLAATPGTDEVPEPPTQQFLTVWPLRDAGLAARLNRAPAASIGDTCDAAVASYDLVTAQHILDVARRESRLGAGRGPFLLAWSPPDTFGREEALILALDLSRVEHYEQALVFMNAWKSDIEQDFEVLASGFSLERLRVKIRRWADSHGEGYLSLLTGR